MKAFTFQLMGCMMLWGSLTADVMNILAADVRQAGDESKQMVLEGNAYKERGQLNEAIWAYGQAAKLGSVEGSYGAGDCLLKDGQAAKGWERVVKISEGLSHLFYAATNRHPQACAQLADALKDGIGVQTNLVRAYVWLALAAKYAPACQADLDRLVVQLEPGDVLQAQKMASEYDSGQWPEPVAFPVEQSDSRFQVQGLCRGRTTLAILNGHSLSAGEAVELAPIHASQGNAGKRLTVSCMEIGPDYVLVAVAGEPNRKLLFNQTR